jgi:hypothetical protein
MSTRSTIGIRLNNENILHIYCHWDGYPEGVGDILLRSYNTRERVLELMKLGDLSVLADEIHPTGSHSFSVPQDGVCIAYARDRGDEFTGPELSSVDNFGEHSIISGQEYVYLMDLAGKWFVTDVHEKTTKRLSLPQ